MHMNKNQTLGMCWMLSKARRQGSVRESGSNSYSRDSKIQQLHERNEQREGPGKYAG